MMNRTTAKWIAACAASAAILSACGGNSPDSSTERSGSQLLADSTVSTSTNLLKNPGFESNGDSWQLESPSSSIHTYDVFFSGSSIAHSGSYYARLNGAGFNAKGIDQTVTVPSGAGTVYLQFWYNIATMTANSNDIMVVGVTPASGSYVNLATFTGASPGSGWQQSGKYDLSAYAGQTVTVRFYSHTESDVGTYFLLDDLVIASDSTSQTTSDNTTFSGNRSNYSIVKTASGYVVTDKTGSEATRTLGSAQALKFNDVTINLGIGDKAQTISSADLNSLIELYIAYLGRIPDADGLSYWIDQFKSGRTLDDIGKSFYDAAVQYPSLTGYSSTMTNADFVTIVYKNVLGRTSVDADGLNYWTSSLASGAQTRGTLVKTILGSAHTFKGDATYGAVADLLDNKIKVGIAYAVQQGITFNSADDSVSKGIAIAAATTSTSTSAATGMYGLVDSGLSLAPTCVTNGNCTASTYALSPTSLDFGTVNVGECGSSTFSVQSTSGSALATGTASANAPFSISSPANFSVSNGSSASITVKFCPSAATAYSDTVTLNSSATFSGANSIAVTGTGKSAGTPPSSAQIAIHAGGSSSLLLKPDGSVWMWGAETNTFNDNTTTYSPVPIKIGTGYAKIATGISGQTYHLIKSDGSLWGWGNTSYGDLGDGTIDYSYTLKQIGTGYQAISNTNAATLAIKSDGSLWSWGANDEGQLGDGTHVRNRSTPAQIGTGFSAASMGESMAAAIKIDGSLWIWGSTGGSINYTPTQVGTGFVAVSSGGSHIAAIKSDGSLWMYGSNFFGQQGTPATASFEYSLKQVGTGYTAVAAGKSHTVALKADGSLWVWGNNHWGQLGDGTTTDNASQRQIGTGYVAVFAGSNWSYGVKSDGSVWSWGYNSGGQLGDGTTTDRHVPTRVLFP